MAKTEKSLDTRLGQILVRRKLCSLQQVNRALGAQRRLKARGRTPPLGKILRDEGALDEEGLRQALAELGALILMCESCGSEFFPKTYESGKTGNCTNCGCEMVMREPDADSSQAITHPLLTGSASAAMADGSQHRTSAQGQWSSPPSVNAQSSETLIGKVFGGCQIVERIAKGGMGAVYKAVQLNLGRTVAVKVLDDELAKDKNFVRRFQQEARAAGQLNHGSIVHINDVGDQQGVFYFVMEYVDGRNLKEILADEPTFEVERTVEIMIEVCKALRHAHNRGVIHRDIKPENIMITTDGVVKVADLGLAKRVSEQSGGITHAGSILGTPFYMAPEQAKDFSKVDARSDIYSLGVTMYRMLTGRVPFYGRSPIEVMIKAIDGKKTPMREIRPEIPPALEAMVDKMMHRESDERYQNVDGLLEDLMRIDVALKSANIS